MMLFLDQWNNNEWNKKFSSRNNKQTAPKSDIWKQQQDLPLLQNPVTKSRACSTPKNPQPWINALRILHNPIRHLPHQPHFNPKSTNSCSPTANRPKFLNKKVKLKNLISSTENPEYVKINVFGGLSFRQNETKDNKQYLAEVTSKWWFHV